MILLFGLPKKEKNKIKLGMKSPSQVILRFQIENEIDTTHKITNSNSTYDKKSSALHTLLPDICSVVGYLIVKWQLKMSDKGAFIKDIPHIFLH